MPAITVEKDNAENVSGLYIEYAEVIESNQNSPAEPSSDDEATDAPIVQMQETADDVHKDSSDEIELSSSGDAYEVFVTCDNKSGIPEDAYLEVQEITQDSEVSDPDEVSTYDEYLDNTLDTLGLDVGLICMCGFLISVL